MIHLIGEAPLVTYLLDAPIDALAVALAGAPVCEYANHWQNRGRVFCASYRTPMGACVTVSPRQGSNN